MQEIKMVKGKYRLHYSLSHIISDYPKTVPLPLPYRFTIYAFTINFTYTFTNRKYFKYFKSEIFNYRKRKKYLCIYHIFVLNILYTLPTKLYLIYLLPNFTLVFLVYVVRIIS